MADGTSHPLTLRPAAADDLEWLVQLRITTMADYLVASGEALSEQEQRERVLHAFDDIRLIRRDTETIGMVKVTRSAQAWHLMQIQVVPAWQGRGVGRQVIAQILSEAHGNNVPVWLSVLKVNPARKLYERLGFAVVAQKENSYAMRADPPRGG